MRALLSIEGEAEEDGEFFQPVAAPVAGTILFGGDVEHPMQAVLDCVLLPTDVSCLDEA